MFLEIDTVERNLYEFEDTYIEKSVYILINKENGKEYKFDYLGYILENENLVIKFLEKCKAEYIDSGIAFEEFLVLNGYDDISISKDRFITLKSYGEAILKVS